MVGSYIVGRSMVMSPMQRTHRGSGTFKYATVYRCAEELYLKQFGPGFRV